jgi:hypothetical protein
MKPSIKPSKKQISLLIAFTLATASSVFASNDPIEVSRLVKCHEGKFDAMNAVSQLTAEITQDTVYGWSGIGAYPDGHLEGQFIEIKAPFQVSATTFVNVKGTAYACVTLSK